MRIRFACLAAALALTGGHALATEAAPAPAAIPTAVDEIGLSFDLYLAGVQLGQVTLDGRIKDNAYFARSTMRTAGVAESLYEAMIEADSAGLLDTAKLRPELYNSTYLGPSKKPEIVNMTFSPMGADSVFADPPVPQNRVPVTPEQRAGTVDPVSAMLLLASGVTASETNPCGTVLPVYDGRRRYDITLTFKEREDVSYDDGYSGPALRCVMNYEQIAGHKPNINNNEPWPDIDVWLAPITSGTGGRTFLMPVRIAAETPVGVAVALATRFQVRAGEPQRAQAQ